LKIVLRSKQCISNSKFQTQISNSNFKLRFIFLQLQIGLRATIVAPVWRQVSTDRSEFRLCWVNKKRRWWVNRKRHCWVNTKHRWWAIKTRSKGIASQKHIMSPSKIKISEMDIKRGHSQSIGSILNAFSDIRWT
jgi:hypothetical protein